MTVELFVAQQAAPAFTDLVLFLDPDMDDTFAPVLSTAIQATLPPLACGDEKAPCFEAHAGPGCSDVLCCRASVSPSANARGRRLTTYVILNVEMMQACGKALAQTMTGRSSRGQYNCGAAVPACRAGQRAAPQRSRIDSNAHQLACGRPLAHSPKRSRSLWCIDTNVALRLTRESN